jgi:hypothetical protein
MRMDTREGKPPRQSCLDLSLLSLSPRHPTPPIGIEPPPTSAPLHPTGQCLLRLDLSLSLSKPEATPVHALVDRGVRGKPPIIASPLTPPTHRHRRPMASRCPRRPWSPLQPALCHCPFTLWTVRAVVAF